MKFDKKYLNPIIAVAEKNCNREIENESNLSEECYQRAFQIFEQCCFGSEKEEFEIKDNYLYHLKIFLDLEILEWDNYPDKYDLDIDKTLLVELRDLIRDRK